MVPSSLTPRNTVVLGPRDMNLAHVASNVRLLTHNTVPHDHMIDEEQLGKRFFPPCELIW